MSALQSTSCALPRATPRRPVRDAVARVVDGARARFAVPAANKQVPTRLPLPDTFRFRA